MRSPALRGGESRIGKVLPPLRSADGAARPIARGGLTKYSLHDAHLHYHLHRGLGLVRDRGCLSVHQIQEGKEREEIRGWA
jgi:hypothetical protein